MKDLKKTFSENMGAVLTAIIAFIFVSYYLFVIIPQNKAKLDASNFNSMEEFNKQFNQLLYDYANNVQLEDLHSSFIDLIKRQEYCDGKEIINRILLDKVKINSIVDSANYIVLNTTIAYKNDTIYCHDFWAEKKIHFISATVKINKKELKERLSSSLKFNSWLIYLESGDKKKADGILINNKLNKIEIDSIISHKPVMTGISFTFSDKRFYKQSFILQDSDFTFTLVGCVDKDAFVSNAHNVSNTTLIVWSIIVLLLLLSVPLIKPVISSPKEKLTQLDLISATICVGTLIIILAIFILTQYLFYNNEIHINEKLYTYNKKVNGVFVNDLSKFKSEIDSVYKDKSTLHILDKEIIDTAVLRRTGTNLQNFFVMNTEGDLIKDKSNGYSGFLRKNFKERGYFKTLKYSLNYTSVISAVHSKYSNKYVMVYAQKEKNGYISGVVFVPELYEKDTVFLDNEYGYLICNKEGRVLLHSDKDKSLNENVYLNNNRSEKLLKLFRTDDSLYFDMDYNGEKCMFFARRIFYEGGRKGNEYPIYLLTYKKLNFENNLVLYVIVNSFIIAFSLAVGIILLSLLYSAFLYKGHIPVFSRYHIYWLFPDNSRRKEFTILALVNYSLSLLFLILFFIGIPHLMYLAIICGINLAFVTFVLLSQRIFLIDVPSPVRNTHFKLLGTIVIISLVLPYILYQLNIPATGMSITLCMHFAYLFYLRKNKNKVFPDLHRLHREPSKKNYFGSFLSSVIAYHYFVVPFIILFSIYSSELTNIRNYNDSYKSSIKGEQLVDVNEEVNEIKFKEKLLNAITLVNAPSVKVLENTDFKQLARIKPISGLKDVIMEIENNEYTSLFMFILSIVIIFYLIRALIRFYSGMFFFFDLAEAYRLRYFTNVDKFANFEVIIPPFNEKDLENLEKYERYSDDEEATLKQNSWLSRLSEKIVENKLKMELIMMDNVNTYHVEYEKVWNTLSPDEKFTMYDFSVDHFVNYKNKKHLMQLMEKGLVIADPLTGRLRVMNYGFKHYVMKNAHLDEAFEKIQDEKGTFSTWRLPIMILAFSIVLLLMYLNKQSLDQILFIGGSVLSAIGLLAKFVETYKKT